MCHDIALWFKFTLSLYPMISVFHTFICHLLFSFNHWGCLSYLSLLFFGTLLASLIFICILDWYILLWFKVSSLMCKADQSSNVCSICLIVIYASRKIKCLINNAILEGLILKHSKLYCKPHMTWIIILNWFKSTKIIPGENVTYWWIDSTHQIILQCKRYRRLRFNPWVRNIPWRRKWQPTPAFLSGKSMDRRNWWTIVHGVVKGWTWLSENIAHS